jgi:hypothetical protein
MVYLLLEQARPGAEEHVVGYYSICPTVVLRDDMPKSLQRGVLRAAPAWLLEKLALDRSLRGDKNHQWGAQPLREALEKIVASVDLGGGQIRKSPQQKSTSNRSSQQIACPAPVRQREPQHRTNDHQ